MDPNEEIVQDIEREIERHLGENCDAADSAEGIRAWWLSPRLRTVPLEHVIAALQRLEQRAMVQRRSVGTGFFYGASRTPTTKH